MRAMFYVCAQRWGEGTLKDLVIAGKADRNNRKVAEKEHKPVIRKSLWKKKPKETALWDQVAENCRAPYK